MSLSEYGLVTPLGLPELYSRPGNKKTATDFNRNEFNTNMWCFKIHADYIHASDGLQIQFKKHWKHNYNAKMKIKSGTEDFLSQYLVSSCCLVWE